MRQQRLAISRWRQKTGNEELTALRRKRTEEFTDRIRQRGILRRNAESPQQLVHPQRPAALHVQEMPGRFQPRIQVQLSPRTELQMINYFTAAIRPASVVRNPEYEQLFHGLYKKTREYEKRQKKEGRRVHILEEQIAGARGYDRPEYLRKQFQKLALVFERPDGDMQTGQTDRILKERRLQKEQTDELRREIIKESTKEVNYMVQKSMKEQINTLTDKVYGKMESRLRDELRRRGR